MRITRILRVRPEPTVDSRGEGGSLSTNDCYNAFEEVNGACRVTGCKFSNSWAGDNGGVLRVSSGYEGCWMEVEGSVVTNSSAGAVSLGAHLAHVCHEAPHALLLEEPG